MATTKQPALLLAIESSCDETSVAVVEDGHIIQSNIVATQIQSHQRFGGVVPEVASRHHVEMITTCIMQALDEASITPEDLDAVAVTYGPGLVGALLIGISAAKAFAFAHQLPLIPVNHMAGHICAAHYVAPVQYPALALVVSGGHTELVYMAEAGHYTIIGETRDDAAGEAYDKVGRVLGVSYPSGKIIDEMAHKGQDVYHFPRAMINEPHLDFSFSGLKSAFINMVHNAEQRHEILSDNDLAASFQAAVVDVLVEKTKRAMEIYTDVQTLIVAGGVAANRELRERLENMVCTYYPHVTYLQPPLALCGDNAAMIGAAGYIEYQLGHYSDYHLNAKPSLTFTHHEDVNDN